MSSPNPKKTRDCKGFGEASAQLTKSRNMAEENLLRHKLRDLDCQRRRSIQAIREEERSLIRDLEAQRQGSHQSSDSDTTSANNYNNNSSSSCSSSNNNSSNYNRNNSNIVDSVIRQRANSRRNSCRNANGASTGILVSDRKNATDAATRKNVSNRITAHAQTTSDVTTCENNGEESRKHLWRHDRTTHETSGWIHKPGISSMSSSFSSSSSNSSSHPSTLRNVHRFNQGRSESSIRNDNVGRNGPIVFSENHKNVAGEIGSDNTTTTTNSSSSSNKINSKMASLPKNNGDAFDARTESIHPPSSRNLRTPNETNAFQEGGSKTDNDINGVANEEMNVLTPRPNRAVVERSPSSERRRQNFSLYRFSKDLPDGNPTEQQVAGVMSDATTMAATPDTCGKPRRSSRPRPVNQGDLFDESVTSPYNESVTSPYTPSSPRPTDDTKDTKELSNSVKRLRSLSLTPQRPNRKLSSTETVICSHFPADISKKLDSTVHRRNSQHLGKDSKDFFPGKDTTKNGNCGEFLNTASDNHSALSGRTDPHSIYEPALTKGGIRKRIVLSPISSRRASSDKVCVPAPSDKKSAKQQSKKKRRESTKSHQLTHESDVMFSEGASIELDKSKTEDFLIHRALPTHLDLTARPMTSWSQRRRSIVFGEDPPLTPREVLNDTHAQWEELGEFLGEIRKQHDMAQSKPPPNPRPKSRLGHASRRSDQSNQSFSSLVTHRLLPRRHSESNILVLSHAVKAKPTGVGLPSGGGVVAPPVASRGGGGARSSHQARRSSCTPTEHACARGGYTTFDTAVKKLVSIHGVLQNSALSMADVDSTETF